MRILYTEKDTLTVNYSGENMFSSSGDNGVYGVSAKLIIHIIDIALIDFVDINWKILYIVTP